MTDYSIRRLAKIMALYSTLEGMKAENDKRKILNESLAYPEEDFVDIKFQFENLANIQDDLLHTI